jgi:transposase
VGASLVGGPRSFGRRYTQGQFPAVVFGGGAALGVDWEKLLPHKSFQVLPRRWVVERTFSRIDQNRRMSKDYEKLCASSEALVFAAMRFASW